MSGRHRKANASKPKTTAVKLAVTGVVLGGGSGVVAGHASAATDGEWDLVSRCESGGDWTINTGNGFHGGLQFTPATWSAYGGGQYAAEAQRATKEQQIAVAERVLATQGRGAWPVCGGPLSGATPRQVSADAAAPVAGSIDNPKPNDVAAQPLNAETPVGPPPLDTPEPPAAVEVVADVTVAPPVEQGSVVDPQPDALAPAPDAAAEPPGVDAAAEPPVGDAAPDGQADAAMPQDAALLPPAGQDSSDPSPDLEAQLVQASATVPGYDSAKEATLVALVHRYSGTPYVWGGDSAAGTDCSGLASWLANVATGRPVFGDRFDTSTEESALLARGFRYGSAPGALVIGWNNHHTAVTLADGTSVASGEGGGVRFGGGGAYQAQFNHHMYLPITPGPVDSQSFSLDPPAGPDGADL
ncbi:hypothetical protein BOO86_15135 [Mycobacterium sp. CBMA 234]|nr:hypothetical protein [Mycolicibacterium sp. CBMA 234]